MFRKIESPHRACPYWSVEPVTPHGHGGQVPRDMVVPPDTSAELDRAMTKIFRDFPRTFELFELFNAHHPKDSHYYLQFIGVHPGRQGTGIGTALLRAMMEQCDLEGVAAYLEADERSRSLYLRHGFEAIGQMRLPNGPSVWPMWRAPRMIPEGDEGDGHRW